jgi:hypothetical protein
VIRSHRFGLGDLCFELSTDHDELLGFWQLYTARFPATGDPGPTYAALVRPEPSFTGSDGLRRGVEQPVDLFALLEGAFLDDLIRELGRHGQVIHAAATAHDGRATLFLGASDAGKSTLCVERVRAGHVYLSDEIAVIRGDEVLAVPRPISLADDEASAGLRPDDDDRFESLGYDYTDRQRRRRRALLYLPRSPLVAGAGERYSWGDVVLLERGESGPPSRRVLDGAERRARLALSRFEGTR